MRRRADCRQSNGVHFGYSGKLGAFSDLKPAVGLRVLGRTVRLPVQASHVSQINLTCRMGYAFTKICMAANSSLQPRAVSAAYIRRAANAWQRKTDWRVQPDRHPFADSAEVCFGLQKKASPRARPNSHQAGKSVGLCVIISVIMSTAEILPRPITQQQSYAR